MTVFKRTCPNCGVQFEAKKRWAEHCSRACKSAFNNRRATRGAVLYDLYMANRYEREAATAAGVLSAMTRLAEQWHKEDAEARNERRSWGDWKSFLLDNVWLKAARYRT